MNSQAKKLIITNIPYLFIALMATKLGQAWRLAEGTEFSEKALHLIGGLALALESAMPSFHPFDLFIGLLVGAGIRIAVHVRGKNAKKYRKNMEYGSARWGTSADIRPYVDPVFRNNVILTQSERLTMNNRPKDPKTARNKNVLIVGGSGSGKTRFWLKPNLMQCHSSYVVTDPKGSIVVECGKLLQKEGYRIKILNTINFKKSMKYNPFAYITTQGIKQMFTRNKKTYVMGGLLFLMVAMIMNGLSSCTPLVQGVLQSVVIATYPAEDADILAAERAYRAMEDDLQNEVNNYPSFHPGYDEYRYELDEIWHDPHVLISLISARIGGEWTIDDVYGTLNVLFERQYTLTQTVTTETRYRKEWVTHYEKKTDPNTGEVTWVPYDVLEDVPYTYRICSVKLENFDLSHLPFYVLSREGVGRYAMYISVHGNRDDLFRGNPYVSPLREYTRHDIPEEYLEDETFARIIEEAEKYLGYPYVWGGDSPETSFDCSGFVSYVFTNSGVRNVGRLGATSLYGACQKITPEQAKPGDLIFFQGTIPGETGISHVGIYVGDGWMIHCGKPVGYQNLNDSYYKQHYFGWGRLAN